MWKECGRTCGRSYGRKRAHVLGTFSQLAKYTMTVKMGVSNLLVSCIVTNLVAQGTRANIKLELNMVDISGIDMIVDGKPAHQARLPQPDYGDYYNYYGKTTLIDRSKMITLRCITKPDQAWIRWFYDKQWISPNATNGRDLTLLATPKDHGEGVKCEANSGRKKVQSKLLMLNFAFDVALEDVRQHQGFFSIIVSGNPNFDGT